MSLLLLLPAVLPDLAGGHARKVLRDHLLDAGPCGFTEHGAAAEIADRPGAHHPGGHAAVSLDRIKGQAEHAVRGLAGVGKAVVVLDWHQRHHAAVVCGTAAAAFKAGGIHVGDGGVPWAVWHLLLLRRGGGWRARVRAGKQQARLQQQERAGARPTLADCTVIGAHVAGANIAAGGAGITGAGLQAAGACCVSVNAAGSTVEGAGGAVCSIDGNCD